MRGGEKNLKKFYKFSKKLKKIKKEGMKDEKVDLFVSISFCIGNSI